MKKNLISFLFGESQVDDEIAGIVESIADIDADGAEDLKVNKQPLTKALSALGIEAANLENDPRGLSLVFGNAEEYRAAHAILNEPDSLHKLAELGWVYSTQGDVAMANEPAELRIRFLEIDEIEPADTKATYSDSDKARLNKVKDIIKKGREFATTEPDFDRDTNPVDHADPKKGKRDKGVGDASDGSNPEGSPKGSTGKPSAGSSGSAPGKGDLTQPKEGDKAKMARQEGIDWGKRLKALRKRRGEPVGEAAFVGHGDGTGTYHSGHGAPRRMPAANVDLSKVAGQIEPHAPGCACRDCGLPDDGDPIGMSSAATRQARGYKGAVPGSPAAGHWPVGEAKGKDKEAEEGDDHEHTYGEVEQARFTGNPHRKCTHPGCKHVSLDLDLDEGKHKAGCQCGFCKNKGNIGNWKKGKKAENDDSGEVEETRTAEQIVNAMLEGNPGTPPGILGTKSFSTMKVPGGSKDRKFQPAKGMVQAAPENSVVAAQTKPNRSA